MHVLHLVVGDEGTAGPELLKAGWEWRGTDS